MPYVPEVYSDYCSQNMMVMERIYHSGLGRGGAGKNGTNMKLLASAACRSSSRRFSATALPSDMHPGKSSSAMSTRKIRSTSASTAE
ncbi:AarF/UbiB family protein [Shigella flexneri]